MLLLLTGCRTAAPGPFPDLEQVHAVEAPAGNVVLVAEPADAEVAVDGVPQGRCSDFDGVHGALNLSRGSHALTVSKPGFNTFATTLYADDGRQRLHIALEHE